MATDRGWSHLSRPTVWVGAVGILLGIVVGVLSNAQPLSLVLIVAAIAASIFLFIFFRNFEQVVLGLLILRSALDPFSAQQVPSVFAVGVNLLILLYIIKLLLSRQKIQTDGFWWFIAGWFGLQLLWVILLPLGGLGLSASHVGGWLVGLREWIRGFSWVMFYLMVMQLKDRVHPEKVVSALFLSLIIPLTGAALQVIVPPSKLPKFLVFERGYSIEAGSRINGTLGHPNVFAIFCVFFIALVLWKLGQAKNRLPWLILIGALAFFLVSTKSLTGLLMIVVFIPAFLAPKLNVVNLIGGIFLFGVIIVLFVSSPLGHERLQSLYATPLLNPDISVSRAIFLQFFDGNSFNWRVAQWTFLLEVWQRSPIFGYGLDTSRFLTIQESYAHNDYVRFIAEQGIVGFSLFLILLIAQFARLTQLCRMAPPGSSKRNLCFTMMAFLTAMLAGMLTDNLWNHTTTFFYWWTVMAVLGWDWERFPESEVEAQGKLPFSTINRYPTQT
ncbi:O-antigen ligase family protein [Phormidesmis priestleyi ULC007]|uniref:O-antigen ligase family protein n=1 Tax=Phormidesmis priestleyi ULC007 TaxID=1920490 RepID=A0A2T1D544_9CYAN|nr:O-antigen ligase family protein [Phormidesmis priestleyi]PSB15598.1 O-antigen ligase family protein [Phormidesmis priestleyi ULC007]